MRQPGDEINVDIGNSRGPQEPNVIEYLFAIVQTANRRRFLIHKRLHSEADAVHTASQQSFQDARGQCTRSALNRNLRLRTYIALRSDGREDSLQLRRFEHRRRPAAQVNGIYRALDLSAHIRGDLWS